jgi:pimeloyl-ACP methyl ester carboxylesterase
MEEDWKQKGNDAFKAGKWDEAIKHYNKALEIDDKQASLYSSRAACWALKKDHKNALKDASRCIELDPKGSSSAYGRKGNALFMLERLDEAEDAYNAGLKIDSKSAVCKAGVATCKEVKKKKNSRGGARDVLGDPVFWRASFGIIGDMFVGIASFVKKIAHRLESGMDPGAIGGRILMHLMMIGFLYVFKQYFWGTGDIGRGTASSANASADGTIDGTRRSFVEINGAWLSYVEAGSSFHPPILLLHRTSLSAETEFGGVIPQLVTGVDSLHHIVALDRPCHGQSPCTEAAETGLLNHFLGGLYAAKDIAYIASGRDAAHHALATVEHRRTAARMLFFRPMEAGVDAKGVSEILAASDSAKRAAKSNSSVFKRFKERRSAPLHVDKLPRGSTITLMYLDGDDEDEGLRKALEDSDVPVDIRHVASLEESLVPAIVDMLAEEGPSTSGLEAEL